MSAMHHTSSLPFMMNIPMQAPQLLYRPPFITGFMCPPTRNMLNYGLVMSPPVPMPCHNHFDEAGLPKRDFVPTSAILNVQCNDIAIALHQDKDRVCSRHKSSHQERGIRKRSKSSNSSFSPSRQEYDRHDKKAMGEVRRGLEHLVMIYKKLDILTEMTTDLAVVAGTSAAEADLTMMIDVNRAGRVAIDPNTVNDITSPKHLHYLLQEQIVQIIC